MSLKDRVRALLATELEKKVTDAETNPGNYSAKQLQELNETVSAYEDGIQKDQVSAEQTDLQVSMLRSVKRGVEIDLDYKETTGVVSVIKAYRGL